MTRIRCLPLHTELSAESCGRRHRLANTTGATLAIKLELEHLENLRCSPCRSCEVGKANADAGRLPPPRRRKNRVCVACETSFEPLTYNATYCSVTCRHKAAKVRTQKQAGSGESRDADRSD